LVKAGVIDEIYSKYKAQIDAVVEATNKNYTKSAEIVSWFYGGSAERWRHVLSSQKGTAMPKMIKKFLKLESK